MQPRVPMNRTLVLKAPTTPSPASEPVTPNNELAMATTAAPDGFVATRRPGMNQLINRDAYDREQKQKRDDQSRTRVAKKQKIDHDERSKLTQYTSAHGNREVIVEGIRFQLREDGSKLIRISGEPAHSIYCGRANPLTSADNDSSKETPRSIRIADVDFFRTKNGNLVRANALKEAKRYHLAKRSNKRDKNSHYFNGKPQNRTKPVQCEHFSKHGTHTPRDRRLDLCTGTKPHRYTPAGKFYSSLTHALGNCPQGPMCRFAHDPSKVTACPKFLKSSCPNGEDCDLSHTPTYSNAPACTYFLHGNCTNDACRYPHVHVSPTAPVCASFARLGFCDNASCGKRHVFECPDYVNTGYCAKAASGRCSLPHPDRASVMRKAAAKQAKMASDNDSDISSDDENEEDVVDVEDIDSDDLEDMTMTDIQNYDHELTQQQDYVAFS